MNEEQKIKEFDSAFCKKIQISDEYVFFIFFRTTHQKKIRGDRTSKIVNPGNARAYGHLPYHCSIYFLARALRHDVECEFEDAQKLLTRTCLTIDVGF